MWDFVSHVYTDHHLLPPPIWDKPQHPQNKNLAHLLFWQAITPNPRRVMKVIRIIWKTCSSTMFWSKWRAMRASSFFTSTNCSLKSDHQSLTSRLIYYFFKENVKNIPHLLPIITYISLLLKIHKYTNEFYLWKPLCSVHQLSWLPIHENDIFFSTMSISQTLNS